jgi:hypothetical protein
VASLEVTVNDLQRQGVEVHAGISEHPWGRVATCVPPGEKVKFVSLESNSRKEVGLIPFAPTVK